MKSDCRVYHYTKFERNQSRSVRCLINVIGIYIYIYIYIEREREREREGGGGGSDQNGVSPLYIMLETHHSGREPSKFKIT